VVLASSGGLRYYIITRLVFLIPTILVLYTLIFIVLRVIPGNPVLAVLGTRYVPPEVLEEKMERLGLNKPLYVQYFEYLWKVLHGDFGESMVIEGRPIIQDLIYRIPATVELVVAGFIMSIVIGLVTGVLAALRRGSRLDYLMRLYGITTYTIFIPWLGSILILLFSVRLGLLPVGGRLDPAIDIERVTGLYVIDSILTGNIPALISSIKHLILPSLTLGIVLSGAYTRLVRVSLSDVLQSEFILAYRSRGVREWKVLAFAFRNAMIPVVTYMGLQLAILLGGAILTETTYSWPGLGSYLFEKILYRDYTAIQGTLIVYVFIVAVVNFVVDVSYAIIDPRVRY